MVVGYANGGIVYGARNRVNGKWYVGQTIHKLKTRMNGHMCKSRKGSEHAFHEALRKYGIEGFSIQVLAACKDKPEMDAAEKFWIKKLNSMAHNGYNLTEGGEGVIPNEEERRRRSERLKGKKLPPEWCKALSEAGKGRKRSAESIRKSSDAQRGKPRPNVSEMLKGKKCSEETRRKLSEATKRTMTPERRKEISDKQKEIASTRPMGKRRLKAMSARPNMKGENNPAYGKKWTEERKAAFSQKLKGRKFSEEHKAKISAAQKGIPKPKLQGLKRSEETRAKISASLTGKTRPYVRKSSSYDSRRGKVRSEETKAKISAALKGKPKPWLEGNNHRAKWLDDHIPSPVSDETCAKISAALKGIPRPWLKEKMRKADWIKMNTKSLEVENGR